MSSPAATIRAVVFDLDDTLYPERQYVRSGYCAVADVLRRKYKRDEPFEVWLWQRFLAGRADGALDALSECFGLGLKPRHIAKLVKVYREHTPDIRPFGDIPMLLGRMHVRWRLGVLSDGFLPAQDLKLDALELRRFFDAVVLTESLGREAWKPSPAGFEYIAEQLGVPHAACCYVGDNPAKDFVAPNALGWRTVRWLRPGQVHAHKPTALDGEPQFTVANEEALLDVLKMPAE